MNLMKKSETNLLIVYENKISTVELLNKVFMEYERRSYFSVVMKKASLIRITDIIKADIVFFIRPNYCMAYQIGKIGKNMGKPIITYCDDDLLNLKKSIYDLIWRKNSLTRLLNITDVFYSPSKRIIEKYRLFIKEGKAFIFDTPIEKNDVNFKKNISDHSDEPTIRILYAASPAHKAFFEEYIGSILGKIVQKYGRHISFTFIGVEPQIDYKILEKGEFIFYSSMPLAEYRSLVKRGKYDIGLAPLEVSEFTKCKYFNKYLEYSMAGIMGIYTKTEPYTNIIIDGINGLLVENSADKWMKALSCAIDDAALRARIISNAQKHIIENFDPDILYKKFATEIQETILDKSNGGIKGIKKYRIHLFFAKLIYAIERIFEMVYKVLQTYKQEGSKGIYRKIEYHTNKGVED